MSTTLMTAIETEVLRVHKIDLDPDLIYFNRVSKSGSTTLQKLIKKLAKVTTWSLKNICLAWSADS